MTIGEDRSFLEQVMDAYRQGDTSARADSPGTRMVEAIQATYLAIVMQDYVRCTELMTDDFSLEIIGPPEIPIVGRWQGRIAVAEAMARNFGEFVDQNPVILGVVAQEQAVLVMARETGRVVKTNQPYDVHWCQWFTFRGDQLCRVLEIFDHRPIQAAYVSGPNLPT